MLGITFGIILLGLIRQMSMEMNGGRGGDRAHRLLS